MTFYTDGREDFDVPPGAEDTREGNSHDPDAPRLRLLPKRTRAEMLATSIQFLCPAARFLARGVSSLITSLGGVGKTRLILQMFNELERGEPLFGCELLRPTRPMRCLYIGAEDKEPFFNYVAAPLLADDADTLPFDAILLPDVWPGFTLTPSTARELADFIEALRVSRGADVVALDPMMSLIGMEHVEMMRNPVVSRAFFNDCLGPLLASQAFALISGNHDSKAGAPVSGSADQQNAARCVLQLSTEGPTTDDGSTAIAAERHKDNLGFRFRKLVLNRDPETLLLTWNEAASVYAYGAPADHRTAGGKPSTDPAAIQDYLCRLAARLLFPTLAPIAQRGKRAIEGRLTQTAARDGHQKAREHVRRCLDAFCDFEPDRTLTKGRRLVLCGVRNPNAAIGDHSDFLAGRAPIEEPSAEAEDPSEETAT